jgi:hypothetical protein
MLLLLPLSAACGVQATWTPRAREPHFKSFEVGGRIVGTRSEGMFIGADLGLGVPKSGDLSPRYLLTTGGYRWLGKPISLELGADIGIGQPAQLAWGGTGMYLGASSALLFRVLGNQDIEVGYSPVGLLADVVLGARGGVWMGPRGYTGDELGDASLLLGFRLTAISDIPVSSNRNWTP